MSIATSIILAISFATAGIAIFVSPENQDLLALVPYCCSETPIRFFFFFIQNIESIIMGTDNMEDCLNTLGSYIGQNHYNLIFFLYLKKLVIMNEPFFVNLIHEQFVEAVKNVVLGIHTNGPKNNLNISGNLAMINKLNQAIEIPIDYDFDKLEQKYNDGSEVKNPADLNKRFLTKAAMLKVGACVAGATISLLIGAFFANIGGAHTA